MGKHQFFNQFKDFMMANEPVYNACRLIQENLSSLRLENGDSELELEVGKYKKFKPIVLNDSYNFKLFYSGQDYNNQPHGNGILLLKTDKINNYCESKHVLA
ncbi:hypothetical protein [Clostridium scatologenes]|uniref:Uncharacterized protein n=1 Tax=Clostridium scatologenes TaxID=1548 RepID=A0A0E3K1G8_CLOSL|nr:hypothetical protein [Clostridium scatologenes]AKA70118.1 hypothetical protein CSCA_2993 [Clostridium scatologenes]